MVELRPKNDGNVLFTADITDVYVLEEAGVSLMSLAGLRGALKVRRARHTGEWPVTITTTPERLMDMTHHLAVDLDWLGPVERQPNATLLPLLELAIEAQMVKVATTYLEH